jgi:Flp pilus assembly protein TadG
MSIGKVCTRFCKTVQVKWRGFVVNESGASIIIIGLAMPALIGAVGLAVEVSYWQLHHRAEQNAADAAAIAAATNPASNYVAVADAVAAQYGFQNGVGNVVVSATNPSTATGCAANCYVVTISDGVPLYLSQVVGYQGSTVNGQHVTVLAATAVATTNPAPLCILALASSGAQGITAHGVSNANLNGCNIMSNTGMTCTGHNLNAGVGDAVGTNRGCGATQNSNVPAVSDPYSGLAANLPANSCGGSYPQETSALPAANKWSGSYTTSGVQVVCGDQQLTADTTINNTTLVIENGQLDTNGHTLHGSGLTVVFTGTNNSTYQHIPTGGGTLDIAAPTSGTWSGVALYQDPNLTTNVNISAAGNTPTWNISGLVYLPHSTVTLSGAVNKSSSGTSCFSIVVDNITINGTGSIFANDNQCVSAGLNQVTGVGYRAMLVN